MPRRSRDTARRSRTCILWGLVFFVGYQVCLVATIQWLKPGLADPEYSLRLKSLHKLQRKHVPTDPLVVVFGSSRVAVGVRPSLFEKTEPLCASGSRPVVMNFGISQAGPVVEQFMLRRLLDDGVRPDLVLVEVWQLALHNANPPGGGNLDVHRLRWRDLKWLEPYHPDPQQLYREWGEAQLVPASSYRFYLQNMFLRSWLPAGKHLDLSWRTLDRCGWLNIPAYTHPVGNENSMPLFRTTYAQILSDFPLHKDADDALRNLLDLCRREKIKVGLLLTPDAFHTLWSPIAQQKMTAYLETLHRDYEEASIIDTRTWLPYAAFADGVHLSHANAALYTERLGREVIGPMLENTTGSAVFSRPNAATFASGPVMAP